MAVLNDEIQVDQVIATGQQVYEVLIDQWGNVDTGADATSLIFPATANPGLPSMYAMAIGARSHVNRFEALYNPQIRGSVLSEGVSEFNRAVDLISPLMFPSAAGPVTGGNAAIRVAPRSQTDTTGSRQFLWGDSYIKEDGTSAPFGGLLSSLIFKQPVLHVYFYVQSPTLAPPTKRAMLTRENSVAAGGGEQLVLVVAIAGRRQVRVKFRASDTLTATGRVAVIQHAQSVNSQESTVANVAGIAAATSGNANIIDPGADFMLVYFTQTGGAGNMTVLLTALD